MALVFLACKLQCGMIAPARCDWTLLWRDNTAWSGIARKPRRGEAQGSAEQDHTRSYGLSDKSARSGFGLAKPGPQGGCTGMCNTRQVQACLSKRGPG